MAMTLFDANGRPLKKAKPEKAIPTGEPIIETTHAENLAARRFLGFLLADINYQVAMMAKDTRVSKADFAASRDAAVLLIKYLSQQVHELDRLITIGEHEHLVEAGLKEHDEDSGAINDDPPSSAIN